MILIALGVMPYITASIVVQLARRSMRRWQRSRRKARPGARSSTSIPATAPSLLTRGPGLFHRRRPRRLGATAGHRRGGRSGHAVPRRRDDQPGRRHHVPDVARRADHQPRHRQRRVADHHGRHRRSTAAGASASCSRAAAPARIDPLRDRRRSSSLVVGLILFICFMERAQRRVLIQYPKRQTARGRCSRSAPPAAQAQHRRRDPADLRLVAAADAADHRSSSPAAARPADSACERLADHHQHLSAARLAALPGALRRRHRLLLLLLHGGAVQSARRRPRI